jgi:hypothetical protein
MDGQPKKGPESPIAIGFGKEASNRNKYGQLQKE